MKIGEKTFVSLSYELKVDGELIEKVSVEEPLEFVTNSGFLLPKFEEQLSGLAVGDTFAFRLESADAYGEVIPEAIVELPQEVFMVEGTIEEGILEVGNQLPMTDNQGNRLVGIVKSVNDGIVVMDFNHPMAGHALEFAGTVVGVRESTPEDLIQGMMGEGCGCGDGCECGDGGCGDDCNCDDGKSGCNC